VNYLNPAITNNLDEYIGYLNLGYDANEQIFQYCHEDSTYYSEFYNLMKWSRIGSSLLDYKIHDDPTIPRGSILDFIRWPAEKRLTSDLLLFCFYRGQQSHEKDRDRDSVLKAVNDIINKGDEVYPVIMGLSIVGVGNN